MKYVRLLILLGGLIRLCSSESAFAQGTAFTYQGQLLANSAVANGTYDLRFELHPSATSTNIIGAPLANPAVAVSNGLFTVILDFGNVFAASPLYLEIAVRTNGSTAAYTVLSPTQLLTSAPYAVQALNAVTASTSFATTGTISDSQLSTNIPLLNSNHLTFPNLVSLSNASGNFTGNFSGNSTGTFTGTVIGNGAGVTNLNVTNLVGVVQSNPNWQIIQSSPQLGVVANNYLTTNNTQQTLILPANPSVGNTLQMAGSGANGWKITQGTAGQSIITAPLGLPAGQNWGVADNNSQAWHALACSSNGLTVAAGIATGIIYYSTNGGQSWAASSSDSQAWSGIASSTDGTRMAAAANNSGAGVYISVNGGVAWTKQTTGIGSSFAIHSIASSGDGMVLVAASTGSGTIFTSANGGTNWTSRISGLNWQGVACSTDGTIMAAASYNGPICVSVNSGVTWTTNTTANFWSCITASASGSKLAAAVSSVSTGYIYTSDDQGITWVPRFGPQNWSNIVSSADGTSLAASSSLGFVYTSSDSGQTWLQRTNNLPSGTQAWSALCSSGNGSRLFAAISTGLIYSSVAATTSGTNGSLVGTQYSTVSLQYIGNGQWMPLSFIGIINGF